MMRRLIEIYAVKILDVNEKKLTKICFYAALLLELKSKGKCVRAVTPDDR